ncbi:MAG: MBL fold metallo-hydrolase [Nanoarchaeota archaeon]
MAQDPSMVIKYWGVRGSIPAPLTSKELRERNLALIGQILDDGGTERIFKGRKARQKTIEKYLDSLPFHLVDTYGGDTSCIEIQARGTPLIIVDAGTGLRHLGNDMMGRLFSNQHFNPISSDYTTKREIHMLFSHYHWDHIQGFPFFVPSFLTGENKVTMHFYGKLDAIKHLEEVLRGQQMHPNFPVRWDELACEKKYHEIGRLEPKTNILGLTTINHCELDHPDSVLAYRFDIDRVSFVYASDTEHRDSPDPGLVKLAKGADILYYDTQYTPGEYRGEPGSITGPVSKFRWGHSTFEWAIRTGLAAGVNLVVGGHLEPARTDKGVYELEREANKFLDQQLRLPENAGKTMRFMMGYQGLEQRL